MERRHLIDVACGSFTLNNKGRNIARGPTLETAFVTAASGTAIPRVLQGLGTTQIEFQAPYELKIVDIDVETDSDGSSEINVRYEGRHGAGAVRQKLPSQEFAVLLACCQALAKRIFDQEFSLNSEVEIDFELTQEDGITIWHTHPSTYL